MAAEYDETNTFKLFLQEKEEGSKKPDLTGRINIGSKVMRLAAWKKKSKKGQTWLSGQVSEMQTKEQVKEEIPF